jgi:hypothetical protein
VTGLETALAGTVANAVSKEVLQWLKSRGPDFSEGDWQGMGLPVGRQIRAVYAQHEAGMMSKEDEVRRQLDQAGRIYRELSFVGEDRGFNPDVVKVYSDLADVCAEWESSPELHLGADPEEHPDRFNELHDRYKELTS